MIYQILANKLKNFDWHYEYSDDHKEWRKGSEGLKDLVKELAELPEYEAIALWDTYAPENYKDIKVLLARE